MLLRSMMLVCWIVTKKVIMILIKLGHISAHTSSILTQIYLQLRIG